MGFRSLKSGFRFIKWFSVFRDEFVVEPLPNLENHTEAIWVKVLLPGEKALYVGSFYRPPKSGSEPLEKLEGVLERIIDRPDNKHLILGGDFNCPSITGKIYP